MKALTFKPTTPGEVLRRAIALELDGSLVGPLTVTNGTLDDLVERIAARATEINYLTTTARRQGEDPMEYIAEAAKREVQAALDAGATTVEPI